MKNRILNRLEYAGLEYMFQNIITTYETEYKGIIPCDISPASEIIKRTGYGIQVADGCYNLYQIENFAIREFFPIGNICVMAGFYIDGSIEESYTHASDILIDVTECLDDTVIDLERLIEKIQAAR